MSRPRFPFIAKDVSALARSLQRELAACAMSSESARLTGGASGTPDGPASDAACAPVNAPGASPISGASGAHCATDAPDAPPTSGASGPAHTTPRAPGHVSHVQLLNMLVRAVGYRNFQHYRAQFAAQERLERLAAPEPTAPEEPVDLRRVERAARHFGPDGLLARWPGKVSLQRLCLWWVWSRLPAGQELTGTQMDDALRACHHFGDHALLRRWLCDLGMATRTPDGRQYRRVEQRPPQEALALLQHLRDRERHARRTAHAPSAGRGATTA
ncbi:F0F1 ATP synthase subunit alpha [Desulfovibrio sp. A2]|nr:F0F1 ATP synthase subunit alpha [Desulfovibrio sp. A2]